MAVVSTEQHGPHLPTKTVTLIGDVIAWNVATKLGKALLAKTISVGCSEHHLDFPGTISLEHSTFKMIIDDYTESLARQGFERIIYIPSHGGNFVPLAEAIEEQKVKHPKTRIIGCCDLMRYVDCLYGISGEFGVNKEEAGAHAGENETTLVLSLAENLVRKDRFAPGYLGPLGPQEIEVIMNKGMPALTDRGVLGDPTKASADRGKLYLEKIVEFLVKEITEQLEKSS